MLGEGSKVLKMPIYGSTKNVEPIPSTRDLPLEKRLELYEFQPENDENEVPSKKVKRKKPQKKTKRNHFFDNLGKNLSKPVKVKIIPEKIERRAQPKRGVLKQISPLENQQSVPTILKTTSKNPSRNEKSKIKESESSGLNEKFVVHEKGGSRATVLRKNITNVTPLKSVNQTRVSRSKTFQSSISKADPVGCDQTGETSNQSVLSDFTSNISLSSHSRNISYPSFENPSCMFGTSKLSSIANQSPNTTLQLKTSPNIFKKPVLLTENLRSRRMKGNQGSTSKMVLHPRCSSPNFNRSPNRTLIFGGTSPIKKSSESLDVIEDQISFSNSECISNQFSSSSVKSLGDDTCVIAGDLQDSYKSVGEEDLCHYFGFDEEEESESISNFSKSIAKRTKEKKPIIRAEPVKLEKPPVHEVLSLLKESIPLSANPFENNLEPFQLSSCIWSPEKSKINEDGSNEKKHVSSVKNRIIQTKADEPLVLNDSIQNKENVKSTVAKKNQKGRIRKKNADESIAPNNSVLDSENVKGVVAKQNQKDRIRKKNADEHMEINCSVHDEETVKSFLAKQNQKGRIRKKNADESVELNDFIQDKENLKGAVTRQISKRTKTSKKTVQTKENAPFCKKEQENFEALAASLNSQFEEIEHFSLAVE